MNPLTPLKCLVLFALCLSPFTLASATGLRRPNVLFIAVDDLRPQLACYGQKMMHTPNIDRLAARGVVFERAYCMVPTCGASRASLMTGIRPAPKRFINWQARADQEARGIKTLNTHFHQHGYTTISNGKVFHHPEDNAQGWSKPAWRPKDVPWYRNEKNHATHLQRQKSGRRSRGPAYESADVADDAYADGVIANRSIQDMRRLAKNDQPFFLAVGFFKPHLPFVAPKKYWDLYDREQIHLPATYHRPKNAPRESLHNSGELRAYSNIPRSGPVPDETARSMIHGYYACVSYIDAQVGRLLDELETLNLADNTIVVLWGDHGWNLGEHTLWCKHSCYETSMHAPLIVSAPGIAGGRKTPGLTEFIDIYPSLSELAGLPLPEHLEGKSFVSLMKNPDMKWKPAAIGRYRSGDTIRTDQYRFSQYSGKKKPAARMLYDHKSDAGEDTNISEQPEKASVVKELTAQLQAGKGKDRP